jgi:transcriptional regulator with XRE-family HTH domain
MDTEKPSAPPASNALGLFLRARRARLSPGDAGPPDSGRRRVPGLRREEVARLAGVGTDYYVRLEQGRQPHPSQQVLDAVAKALRLDRDAVAELNRMTTVAPRSPRRPTQAERVSPHLRRLVESWSETPVFVLGRSLDVLATNQLAHALTSDFARRDNAARMTFLDPAAHGFFHEWRRAAAACAAALRQAADTDPNEPGLLALVGELSVKSTDFQAVWARPGSPAPPPPSRFRHGEVGDLELRCETFSADSAPGQRLVVFQAEPGSRSADALALLGSLSAPTAPHDPE